MESLPQLTPVMGKGLLSAKLNQTTHCTSSTLSVALLLNDDHVKVIPEYWFNTISQKKETLNVELCSAAHRVTVEMRNLNLLLRYQLLKVTVELFILAHWFHPRKVEHCRHAGVSVTLTKKHPGC